MSIAHAGAADRRRRSRRRPGARRRLTRRIASSCSRERRRRRRAARASSGHLVERLAEVDRRRGSASSRHRATVSRARLRRRRTRRSRGSRGTASGRSARTGPHAADASVPSATSPRRCCTHALPPRNCADRLRVAARTRRRRRCASRRDVAAAEHVDAERRARAPPRSIVSCDCRRWRSRSTPSAVDRRRRRRRAPPSIVIDMRAEPASVVGAAVAATGVDARRRRRRTPTSPAVGREPRRRRTRRASRRTHDREHATADARRRPASHGVRSGAVTATLVAIERANAAY